MVIIRSRGEIVSCYRELLGRIKSQYGLDVTCVNMRPHGVDAHLVEPFNIRCVNGNTMVMTVPFTDKLNLYRSVESEI